MTPKPVFFANAAKFGEWLAKNHERAEELWVGFYKKNSGKANMTWPEAVDEALCYGWIDGLLKPIDVLSYAHRFTPRKLRSNWSKINIAKVAKLAAEGRMQPAGIRAFESRSEARSGVYSFEQRETAKFDAATERRFRSNKKAWHHFQAQTPSYRRTVTFWALSAKKEEARQKRLDVLISSSEEGLPIPPLRFGSK